MQTSSTFNLIHATQALQRKWKTILLIVIAGGVVAALTVVLMPKYFRSTATLISANPTLADKARLFNSNIQGLYSYFGSGDDLDRIQGVAAMDTTFYKLVDEFALVSYYELSGDSLPLLRRRAVLNLRRDLSFQRTEQGQLKIAVWTKNKQLSANIINRMVAIVQETQANVWQKNYNQSITQLHASIASMEEEYKMLSDSAARAGKSKQELVAVQMQTLLEQLKQYRKTEDDFKLAAQTPPPVLYVMESAVPAPKAERPDKPGTVLAACIAAFLFSSLWVLINNRNRAA